MEGVGVLEVAEAFAEAGVLVFPEMVGVVVASMVGVVVGVGVGVVVGVGVRGRVAAANYRPRVEC